MVSISDYNPFFIKKSFNLPEYKPKEKKRIVIDYDNLFYELFNKINKYDITNIKCNDKFNEKQEKIKIAVEIEKLKIKNKDKELIIQNLMYENKINLKTLNALCIFYKINLIYVKDNIYITMYNTQIDAEIKPFYESCEKPQLITNQYYMVNDKIVDTDLHSLNLNKKHNVNLDKPLRCISYYKLEDLRLISDQLHLPTENIKKQQLYDSIQNVLTKLNIS